jgi:hypothetical protein
LWALHKMQKVQEAADYMHKIETMPFHEQATQCYGKIGNIFMNMELFSKAAVFFQKQVDAAKDAKSSPDIVNSLLNLAKAHSRQGSTLF